MAEKETTTPVRQLMDKNNILINEDWRFLRRTDGKGNYTGEIILLARRPLHVSNNKLLELLESNKEIGLELATTKDLVDSLRPFDHTNRVYKSYEYIWGNRRDFKDATEPFIYQGIGRNGMLGVGPSNFGDKRSEDGQRGGLWAVTSNGNRLFAPWNIHGSTPLETIVKGYEEDNAGNRGERGEIAGNRGERGASSEYIIRQAGYYSEFNKELEENEGYILTRKPTKKELEFFNSAIQQADARLAADNGILCICPPNFETKKAFFIPAGGCAECSNQGRITISEISRVVKNKTDIELILPEEVKRYLEIMEKNFSKGMLSYQSRHAFDLVRDIFDLQKDAKLTASVLKQTWSKVPLSEIKIFNDKLDEHFGKNLSKQIKSFANSQESGSWQSKKGYRE
jgi:hypothetical protein